MHTLHNFYHSAPLESLISEGPHQLDIDLVPRVSRQGVAKMYASVLRPILAQNDAYVHSPCTCNDCALDAAADIIAAVGDEVVTREGKIAKRIAKWIYKTLGIRLSEDAISSLGNVAYQCSASVAHPIVDITNNFDWRDGQYGHEGSCYWGSYSASRDMILDANGLCLRYYNDLQDSMGSGRTWIIPVSDESVVLFNAYGRTLSESAAVIAYLLETMTLTRYEWVQVSLYNRLADSLPYVNGMTGIVVYPAHAGWTEDSIDLNIPYHEGYYYHRARNVSCYACGYDYDVDDVVEGDYGQIYCRECYAALYATCDNCGREVYTDEAHECEGDLICDSCYVRYATACAECDAIVYVNHTTRYPEGSIYNPRYCDSCLEIVIARDSVSSDSELSESVKFNC